MKLLELPENFKQYILILNNGSEYKIDGDIKEKILNSHNNFIQLPNGSVIMKSYIIEIKLNISETKDYYEENKNKLTKI